MTVKELIKELNKHDKNADVCVEITAYGEFWDINGVCGVLDTEDGSRVILSDKTYPVWYTDENGIRGFIV